MTKRPYRRGRTVSAPGARLTAMELSRLRAVEQRDGVSHADWIMKHVTEDERMADKTNYVAWCNNGKNPDDPDFENRIERVSGYTKAEAKETAKKQIGYKFGWSTVTINRISKVE